jgi:beta-glucosidase
MNQTPLYRDHTRPVAERVQDLIARLTLEEKIGQLLHNTSAIPRLGIPAYNYWNEALHGVARNGRATVFPQAIGMAATWDIDLIKNIAAAIGDEARAKYNAALQRKGETGIYQGLTFWSPNINIFRDPRWGRGQETWGEDPFLTGEMGMAFVEGLQGDDPVYLKVAACAKHFAVHSGPEKLRHSFNAVVSAQDLHTTYLPAFKKLVTEAKVAAVMGAYNRTNGEPCCASQLLLGDILRGDWQFEGQVVSDCGALGDIHEYHRITNNVVESAALALKRGCDLSCIGTYNHLGKALEQGLIEEADIDRALARNLTLRFRLGMFDPPEAVPFNSLSPEVVNNPAHRELAYEAACKSVVLFKNKDNLLPLGKDTRSILVTGPMATDLNVLLGNYHGLSDTLTSLLSGIVGAMPEGLQLEYRPGCQITSSSPASIEGTLGAARQAEIVIACMGLSPLLEGEEGDAMLSESEGDRVDLNLPAVQIEFLRRLAAQGSKVVLVLSGGSPIALGELADLMTAIVFIWYPGQEGGRAVADVLFGKVVPSGKLPLTFPARLEDLPPFEDYAVIGRTYRYTTAQPLYPFGFGLSYSRFHFDELKVEQAQLVAGEALRFQCNITNEGRYEAEEVVQVYLSPLDGPPGVPLHTLVSFQRVRLTPGQTQTLDFELEPEVFQLVNEQGESIFKPGQFRLTVGGASPGELALELGAPQPLSTVLELLVTD